MKKAIWLLLLAILIACGPATTATQPVDTEVEEDSAVAAEETNDEGESESSVLTATGLEDFTPTGSVEEAAVIRTQDWQKGATDPLVVIIEYSDFQ